MENKTNEQLADGLIETFYHIITNNNMSYSWAIALIKQGVSFHKAKECALVQINAMIHELNHHNDLQGFYQDEAGTQTIIQRIEHYKNLKQIIETKYEKKI